MNEFRGPFYVIVEKPGRAPAQAGVHRKHEDAVAHATALARLHFQRKGTKVTVLNRDSRDQLQMTKKGPVRDQPELPAYGENVRILAPTAKVIVTKPNIKP
jgi:hypothetical protein